MTQCLIYWHAGCILYQVGAYRHSITVTMEPEFYDDGVGRENIMSLIRWLLVYCMFVLPTTGFADEGSDVYRQTCAICHATGVPGIPGVPKLGAQMAWSGRLAAGRPAMLHSVLRGKGAMPPKGGNASLSDAQASAALDYMLSKIDVKIEAKK